MEERYIIVSYTISDDDSDTVVDGDTCFLMVKGKTSMVQIGERIRKLAKDNYPEFNWSCPSISGIEIIDRASAEILYPDYFSSKEKQ